MGERIRRNLSKGVDALPAMPPGGRTSPTRRVRLVAVLAVRDEMRYLPGIVSLDADHRIEHQFRDRVERLVRRGRPLGISAYAFRLRELWGARDRYRSDGLWGEKLRARLFRARADHQFDDRELHAQKAPVQSMVFGNFIKADLEVYHLRMIDGVDRIARRERYEELDPDARWQPKVGYVYLTDEAGLQLQTIPAGREWTQ